VPLWWTTEGVGADRVINSAGRAPPLTPPPAPWSTSARPPNIDVISAKGEFLRRVRAGIEISVDAWRQGRGATQGRAGPARSVIGKNTGDMPASPGIIYGFAGQVDAWCTGKPTRSWNAHHARRPGHRDRHRRPGPLVIDESEPSTTPP